MQLKLKDGWQFCLIHDRNSASTKVKNRIEQDNDDFYDHQTTNNDQLVRFLSISSKFYILVIRLGMNLVFG